MPLLLLLLPRWRLSPSKPKFMLEISLLRLRDSRGCCCCLRRKAAPHSGAQTHFGRPLRFTHFLFGPHSKPLQLSKNCPVLGLFIWSSVATKLTHAGCTLDSPANGRGKEILHAAQLPICVGESRPGATALRPRHVGGKDLAALAVSQVCLPAGASWN